MRLLFHALRLSRRPLKSSPTQARETPSEGATGMEKQPENHAAQQGSGARFVALYWPDGRITIALEREYTAEELETL